MFFMPLLSTTTSSAMAEAKMVGRDEGRAREATVASLELVVVVAVGKMLANTVGLEEGSAV